MPGQSTRMQQQRKLWREMRAPISVFFELTPRCTLDCKMCYVHLTPEQMGERRELPTEEWLRIVDEAIEAGMLYGVLTGGECMLHPGFWQIYERLIAGGVVLSVNTNGYALRDEDIARFADNPPASIRITLYGASEESYEACTGHRAYRQVVENIKKLQAVGIKPKLTTTVSRYNRNELTKVLALQQELGLRIKYTFDLFEPREDTGRHSESFSLSPQQIVEAEREAWLSQGMKLFQNPPAPDVPERMPEDPEYRGLACAAGRTSYTICWDGCFTPCFNIPSDLSVFGHSVKELWPQAQKLADEYLLPVECRSCKLLHVCNPCPAYRHDLKEQSHCNPQRCYVTKLRYEAGLSSLETKKITMDREFDQDQIHEAL